MQKKEFLAKLEEIKGKDIIIEIENETIQKTTIEKNMYEIKEDKLHIRSTINLDDVEINLNTIRDIQISSRKRTIFIDDTKSTKVKISAI